MRARFTAFVLLAGILGGCRGQARGADPSGELAALVDSLAPAVEKAAGLTFRSPPRSALRSRDQVRAYLLRKLDEELPPARLRGIETAYRLFGLLPDTLQLRGLLLELYTEQVAGFYDPDSAMLFGVAGADRSQLRLVLAHEMIHALQGQYLPLDSILTATSNNDRLTAAQAILEGQATLASLEVLAPGQDVAGKPEFWELYREQVGRSSRRCRCSPGAAGAARGAHLPISRRRFMHWWRRCHWRTPCRRAPDAGVERAGCIPTGTRAVTCRSASRSLPTRRRVRGRDGRARSGSSSRCSPARRVQTVVPWAGATTATGLCLARRPGAGVVRRVGRRRAAGRFLRAAGAALAVPPGRYRAAWIRSRWTAARRGTSWRLRLAGMDVHSGRAPDERR
jgi:hypothetical protein